MGIYEHVTEFAGKPVEDWDPESGIADPRGTIYRLGVTWERSDRGQKWLDLFSAFLNDPASREVTGLVVGVWGEIGSGSSEGVVEALVAARERLPNLKAVFLGDMTAEECEISWIAQSDVTPLLQAYPELERLRVRGAEGLALGGLRHAHLKELALESGGLPRAIVHSVFAAEVPALEHLELWLGDDGYGADTTVEDLAPLLSGKLFPNLRYLGLRDSEITDEIAGVIANAPVLEELEVLDLSLGTLSDAGAQALLDSLLVRELEKLDIHHHYCSPEMVRKLEALGIEVDASDPKTPDEWDGELNRYVAVSE